MCTLHLLGAVLVGALDGAARVLVPGFYAATGDDRAELDRVTRERDVARSSLNTVVDAQVRTDAIATQLRIRAEAAEERAERAEASLANAQAGWADARGRAERNESRALRAEADTAFAVYVARLDAYRERLFPELEVDGHLLYRSLTTGTFVIRKRGAGRRLVDEPTIEACIRKGIALGLLKGPPEAPSPPAFGADDERFAVLSGLADDRYFMTVDGKRVIDREAAAWAAAVNVGEVVRIVPADAKTVDLDAIRDAIGVLAVADSPLANKLRAAIGDTSPARPARD